MNVSVGQNKPTETDFVTQLGGASDPELAFTLLSELLDATALVSGERLALVHNDLRLTWKEVADRSRDLAKAMLANGICKGENVALWLPNHPAWLIHWLAAVRIGAVVVPINTRYKPSEAAYILSKSEAVTLVIEKQFGDIDFTESFKAICPDWDGKKSAKMPNLRNVILLDGEEEGMQAFEEFADQAERVSDVDLAVATAKLRTDDIIIIVFTSGTTGTPKGVMHTHKAPALIFRNEELTDFLGKSQMKAYRYFSFLPLNHHFLL